MALSEGKKESLPNAQDLQTVYDNGIGSRCELPNFIGTLSKHISVICFRWLALFLSLKASYRLHQLRSWGDPDRESHQRYLRNKDFLLGVDFPLSFPNLCSCPLLKVSSYLCINCLLSTFSFLLFTLVKLMLNGVFKNPHVYPGTGGSRGKGWQIPGGVPGQLGLLKRETLSRKTKSKQNPNVLRGLNNVLSYTFIMCLFFMCKCFVYFIVVKNCLACSLLNFPLCFILCVWEFCLHVRLCSVGD